MRVFVRSKFSRGFVHKKKFGLIWQEVFKLGYLLYQGSYDKSVDFEWTQWKAISQIYSW